MFSPGDKYAATAFINAASEVANKIYLHLCDRQLLEHAPGRAVMSLYSNILLSRIQDGHWFCPAHNSNLVVADLQCREAYGTLVMKFYLTDLPDGRHESLRLIIEFNEKGGATSVRAITPQEELVLN